MESVKALIQEINKKLGDKGKLVLGPDISNAFTSRLSSGSLSLDIALSGGFPCGGISEILGRDGSGKSTLAMKACAQVQRQFGKNSRVAWCGVEHALDLNYAQRAGMIVDNRVVGVSAESAESMFDTIIELTKSREFQLIVVDSIASLTPEEEGEGTMQDLQRGLLARTINKWLRKGVWSLLNVKKDDVVNMTAILVINQIRIKQGYAPHGIIPKEGSGGMGLKHAKMVSVELTPGTKIVEGTGENKIEYGKEIRFSVLKGKCATRDGGFGSFDLYHTTHGDILAGNIDLTKEARSMALIHGLAIRKGPRNYVLYDHSYNSKEEFENALKEPELYNKLRTDLLEKTKL